MNPDQLAQTASRLAQQAVLLSVQAQELAHRAAMGAAPAAAAAEPFIGLLAVFLLACFVGYYVVWNVTPALHSPLMGVTNAISSVIIVGAMLATGLASGGAATVFGFLAVLLASVNIFGGFVVTGRMLAMFRAKGDRRPRPAAAPAEGAR